MCELCRMNGHHYYIYYKPFGVLSQFTDEGEHQGLKRMIDVEKEVYPVGRLDRDSEGLLILTDDVIVNNRLLDPKHGHTRCYLAQVEGEATGMQVDMLTHPMDIKVKKSTYRTRPCKASLLVPPPALPERNPPIRYRASIPTSWVKLELKEGKNRQVRKMTAKVGLPTLRLVRWSVEDLSIEGMQPGELKRIARDDFYHRLKLNHSH